MERAHGKEVVVFVTRTRMLDHACLASGILVTSIRAVDFADEDLSGFRLGEALAVLEFGVFTEGTDTGYTPDGERLVFIAGEKVDIGPKSTILEMASNRALLRMRSPLANNMCPFFIGESKNSSPVVIGVSVELAVSTLSELPDFEAALRFERCFAEASDRVTPLPGGDSYAAQWQANLALARTTRICTGMYLPIDLRSEDGVVGGVLYLTEKSGNSTFKSSLFLADRPRQVRPGAAIHRNVEWTEGGCPMRCDVRLGTVSTLLSDHVRM